MEFEKQRKKEVDWETAIVQQVVKRIREYYHPEKMSREQVHDTAVTVLGETLGDAFVDIDQHANMVKRIYGELRGYGLLESILDDESITEVMVHGPDQIFIERKGQLERYPQSFGSKEELRHVISKIVETVKRSVDTKNPIQDARLSDGSRVHVVLSNIAQQGDILTIRKFTAKPMTIDMLIEYGSITPDVAEFLDKLVKAKYNIFVSGGTGSGKTTYLNALSNFIQKDQRIITIEDSAELRIDGIDNLVSLETRNKNDSGEGGITIQNLIKASLRMRPDRIVVGEVRGEEALDMLQAMNTGHEGSMSTGHANSAKDMLTRLETMIMQGGSDLPLDAIRRQIGSALDIIIHLSRLRDKSRKTMEIVEVLGYQSATAVAPGDYILNTLYKFEIDREKSTPEKVVGQLKRTKNKMENREKLELAGFFDMI